MTLISEPLPPNEIKLHWTLSVNQGKIIKPEEELIQQILCQEVRPLGMRKRAGRWGPWASGQSWLSFFTLFKKTHIEETKPFFPGSVYTVSCVLMVERYFSTIYHSLENFQADYLPREKLQSEYDNHQHESCHLCTFYHVKPFVHIILFNSYNYSY